MPTISPSPSAVRCFLSTHTGSDFEYEYEDGEEYDYGSDNDPEAEDDLIEIENAFYEGEGERMTG